MFDNGNDDTSANTGVLSSIKEYTCCTGIT